MSLADRWPLDDHVELRDELLAVWDRDGYHDRLHLTEVLDRLDALAAAGARFDDTTTRLAAWFHDAVYDGVPGQDEEESARLAEVSLRGLIPADDAAEVSRLVRMTADHSPDDHRGALLSDADLSILGQIPGRYHVYVRDVRLDYAHVDDGAWRVGRASVLRRLLGLEPLFRTGPGRELWEPRARRNLADELAALES